MYNAPGIYNIGEVGGGSDIKLLYEKPVFVKQTTNKTDVFPNTVTYDARLDLLLGKIPSGYEQHRYLRNTKSIYGNAINTGIVAEELDDDVDIDIITCFYLNKWVQYAKIIGNVYIDESSHYFAIACGGSYGIQCFVDSDYNGASDKTYSWSENARAIILRHDYANDVRIARAMFGDPEDYLTGNVSGARNNSEISVFSSALVSIYYLQIRKNGVVVRDFVPCTRNVDGISGFYDKVTNSFFTNTDGDGLIAED